MFIKVTNSVLRSIMNLINLKVYLLYIISYYGIILVTVLYLKKKIKSIKFYIKYNSTMNRCIYYTRYASVELIKTIRLPLRGIK